VTRASRFLIGLVTRFAPHHAIPAGRSITAHRPTTAPKQAGPKPGRVASVLRKVADGTSRRTRSTWTRLMPAPGYDLATQVFGLGVQAKVLARRGEISAALTLAEQLDRLARTSEDPRNPGDTALYLAEIMYLSGNLTRAEEMTQRAIDLYESKGAIAFAMRARRLAAQWASACRQSALLASISSGAATTGTPLTISMG
jgi:ATP/maltotriose-dependent transcriptional regulator MalT